MSKRKVFLPTRFSLSSLITFCLFATALTAGSTERVLYSFQGGKDGAHPEAQLVSDAAGNLYGTTSEGGSGCGEGCGTVFKLSPPSTRNGAWTKTTLFEFDGDDGSAPEGGLIFDKAGNLYGTTATGGAVRDGSVFKLTPPTVPGGVWSETVLYEFGGGNDGSYPRAALAFDAEGNLYGTAFFGGSQDAGVVFQLVPPAFPGGSWTESIIHVFTGINDGAQPFSAPLIDPHGNVYGTTQSSYSLGGGIFFRLTPPANGGTVWKETLLYVFDDQTSGAGAADLIFDRTGHLYGTNNIGGANNCGTVYELTPPTHGAPWTATVLHTFTGGSDGNLPTRQLAEDPAGNLYGTTTAGSNGSVDTVFELTRPANSGEWRKTTLHEFVKQGDGTDPEGGLIYGKFGALYGTTYSGGESNNGTIYGVLP
jgi:uncharacterized repeat protein (TIGR03803 family)